MKTNAFDQPRLRHRNIPVPVIESLARCAAPNFSAKQNPSTMSELIPHPSMKALAGLFISFFCTLTLCAAATTATDNDKSHMSDRENYSTSFTVDQSPKEVFDAINNVRGWWSGEIKGVTDKLGAEFTYSVPNVHYSKQKITEFVPGEKIVWHVQDADLTFLKDKSEWKGTDIVFEIAKKGQKTEVRFTHRGLVPTFECYDKCTSG